jgi:hypothetical protein
VSDEAIQRFACRKLGLDCFAALAMTVKVDRAER